MLLEERKVFVLRSKKKKKEKLIPTSSVIIWQGTKLIHVRCDIKH